MSDERTSQLLYALVHAICIEFEPFKRPVFELSLKLKERDPTIMKQLIDHHVVVRNHLIKEACRRRRFLRDKPSFMNGNLKILSLRTFTID